MDLDPKKVADELGKHHTVSVAVALDGSKYAIKLVITKPLTTQMGEDIAAYSEMDPEGALQIALGLLAAAHQVLYRS